MNITLDKLAKKYAQAFINLYGDACDVDTIEKIDKVSAYLTIHRQALFYVQIALLDQGQTKRKLGELIDNIGLEPLLRPLIDLLIDHRRIYLLARVLEWISRLALERKNIMKFTIESASALNEHERVQVRQFLSKQTGKQIIDRAVVNKNLIAGLKVYSETMSFERSIRKQLRALKSMK